MCDSRARATVPMATGIRPELNGGIMFVCDETGCTGHLGKFGSCVDEAAYLASFDVNEWTGDTDWDGHFSLVKVDTLEYGAVILNEGARDAHTVQLQLGAYIVQTYSSGFVDSEYFADVADGQKKFDEISARYLAWELADDSL